MQIPAVVLQNFKKTLQNVLAFVLSAFQLLPTGPTPVSPEVRHFTFPVQCIVLPAPLCWLIQSTTGHRDALCPLSNTHGRQS